MKLRELQLNEVVLVRNWLRGVERWILHVDHLKSARWIQSSSSWEGEEDSNYARNLLSSQAQVKGGAWNPSEPLVNTSDAEELRTQVTWRNRTQLTGDTRIIIGRRFGGSKSLRGTIVNAHSTEVPESREETTTQTHM